MSYETGKEEDRIDVTGKTDTEIEKIERGININLNHDKYYTTYN